MTVGEIKEKLKDVPDSTVLVGVGETVYFYYELEQFDNLKNVDFYDKDGELIRGNVITLG